MRPDMHKFSFTVIALIIFTSQIVSAQEARHERIEWSDIWVVNAEENEHPRVLLVGDSIVRGYYSGVEKLLDSKADCARYTTSKFLGNPDYLEELSLIIKRYDFEIIHINNGLHGWAYTEDEYKDGLQQLLKVLRRDAPNAKLIWCMTTPVRVKDNVELFADNNARAIERNKIAADVMKKNNIPVNNLYHVVVDHPEFFSNDGVHFNNDGKEAQAKAVAGIVEKYLSK